MGLKKWEVKDLGGVIIDGRAVLRYKGPILGFVKVLNEFEAIQKKKGTVMIDTVPVPDHPEAMTLEIQMMGIPISEFGEMITKMEMVAKKLKELGLIFDTIAPPPRGGIPPLPKPKDACTPFEWTISTRVD